MKYSSKLQIHFIRIQKENNTFNIGIMLRYWVVKILSRHLNNFDNQINQYFSILQ